MNSEINNRRLHRQLTQIRKAVHGQINQHLTATAQEKLLSSV